MITVDCKCGLSMRLQDDLAGKKVRCPSCFAVILLNLEPNADLGGAARMGRSRKDDDDDDDDRITHKPKKRPAPSKDDDDDDDDDDDRKSKKKKSSVNEEPVSSGKATVALICGLGTCCLPGILTLPALIFGFLAISDINNSDGKLTGMGKAITGLIFGFIGNGIAAGLYVGGFFLLMALGFAGLVGAVGVGAVAMKTETTNNMKNIGLAAHAHNDQFRNLPTPSTPKGLSWRYSILPFIEQDPLFRQIDKEAAWDTPRNRPFLMQRPPIYLSKVQVNINPETTSYQTTVGPNGLFRNKDEKLNLTGILDGTSNTIFMVDAQQNFVPWLAPQDLHVANGQPLPRGLNGSFLAVMTDGSVRTINRAKVQDNVLRQLFDGRDGAAVNIGVLD